MVSQSGLDEDLYLIRRFSHEMQNRDPQSDVMRAVSQLNIEEHEREAQRYQKYFNDVDISRQVGMPRPFTGLLNA